MLGSSCTTGRNDRAVKLAPQARQGGRPRRGKRLGANGGGPRGRAGRLVRSMAVNGTATSSASTRESEPGSPLDEPLLCASDAAKLLAVRPSWVYEAVRAGRLPHLKVGRHVRFLRSDLERWVLDQRRGRLI